MKTQRNGIRGLALLALVLMLAALGLSAGWAGTQAEEAQDRAGLAAEKPTNQATSHRRRVPCWAPPALATCTPTVPPQATETPTLAPTDTATSVPQDTATPTAIPPTSTTVPTNTATPTRTPTRTATAAPSVTPGATATPDYRNPPANILAAEEQMRQLINQHRVANGQQPFLHIGSLDLAQRKWAVIEVVTNQCGHADFGQRAVDEGYLGFPWGEAGSCGYVDAPDALQGWLDSPAHRGIVEAVTMTEYGVGAQTYPNGRWQFWLLVGCNEQIPCTGSLEMAPRPAPAPPLVAPDFRE